MVLEDDIQKPFFLSFASRPRLFPTSRAWTSATHVTVSFRFPEIFSWKLCTLFVPIINILALEIREVFFIFTTGEVCYKEERKQPLELSLVVRSEAGTDDLLATDRAYRASDV